MEGNFTAYAFEGLYLCEESGNQKLQRFTHIAVQGDFSLIYLSHFYSLEGKWFLVLQEESITKVFILFRPQSFLITFVSFLNVA